MKKFVVLLPAVALAMFVIAGCSGNTKSPAATGTKSKDASGTKSKPATGTKSKPATGTKSKPATGTKTSAATGHEGHGHPPGQHSKTLAIANTFFLCGKCGQIKGTAACCKPGVKACTECGLAKGAPGCCKITKGENVLLCSKCGQIKGTDACCKENALKCGACGLALESPGCCKIKVATTKGGSDKEPFSEPSPEKDAPKTKGT